MTLAGFHCSLLGFLDLLVKPVTYKYTYLLLQEGPVRTEPIKSVAYILLQEGVINGEHVTQLNRIELPHHLNNASLFTHYYRIGQTLA